MVVAVGGDRIVEVVGVNADLVRREGVEYCGLGRRLHEGKGEGGVGIVSKEYEPYGGKCG